MIIQNPKQIITPKIFHKYCQLMEYVITTKEITNNLIETYESLLFKFLDLSDSNFINQSSPNVHNEENQQNKINYADLLLKNCLVFLSNCYDFKQPIQSTEHINVLLQLFFDKTINLKQYVSLKYIDDLRELFVFIYEDNIIYTDNEHHAKTFQLMLYLLLYFFRQNVEDLENYFKKYNFIYTNLMFENLILYFFKIDDMKKKLTYDINIPNRVELESFKYEFIFTLFKIACEILLKRIENKRTQEETIICINSYKIVDQFIKYLLPLNNDDALKKSLFSKESFLVKYFSKCLSLSSSEIKDYDYLEKIRSDFCNITQIIFSNYPNSFVINTIYEVMANYYLDNEKELSDLFFRFIEQVHSIHKESNIKEMFHYYCFNLIGLLQKIALIFENKKIGDHIIKHRNHVIELCHFFEVFKLKDLFKSKASLLINDEYKLIIEIAFDLLIKCYLQFPDEVIINTIGYILHNVDETKDNNKEYIRKENIWIFLDKFKSDNLAFLSNEKHPRINDVNLSITFIIKVHKLINQQPSNNKRIIDYLTNLYNEIIEALYENNQKSFFFQSKSKLYNNIVHQFEENIHSQIKLRDLHKNINNIFEQYEVKKEITSEEYNCFRISKSMKLMREGNKYKRSVSNEIEIPLDNNSIVSALPSSDKKRTRVLSDNVKKCNSSKNAIASLLKTEKEENIEQYNFTLEEYEQTVENSSEVNSEINSQKQSSTNINIQKQQKYIYKYVFDNLNEKIEATINDYSFELIEKNKTLFSPKKELLLNYFSLQFKDIYFYSENFIKMKSVFPFDNSNVGNFKLLNYPTKIRNFSDFLHPNYFLKIEKSFFENKYFPVSHSYIHNNNILSNIKKIPFKKKINYQTEREYSFECEFLNLKGSLYGKIRLYNNFIEFKSDVEDDPRTQQISTKNKFKYIFSSVQIDNFIKEKHILIYYSEIKELLIKRYVYMLKAIEIFGKNGKTYFINFFSEKTCNEFFEAIKQKIPNKNVIIDSLEMLKEKAKIYKTKWESNEISTFKYLLYLNKLSTRSFNDGNQYPIFPWLLKDFTYLMNPYFGLSSKEKKGLRKYKCTINQDFQEIPNEDTYYRNMSFPIGLQTQSKRKIAIEKFKEFKEANKYGYHSGNHYSTFSFVIYYLMRNLPYTHLMISLQNGVFESPNRMITSLHETQRIIKNSTDNRELIPEIFSNIHYMLNLNYCYFGKIKLSSDLINHFQIITDSIQELFTPKTIGSYVQYLLMHRKLLNSPKIKKEIVKWIDYTFGYKQLDSNENSCLIFYKYCYAQNTDLLRKFGKLKEKYSDIKFVEKRLINLIHLIINFGQTPYQILESFHNLNNQDKDIENIIDEHYLEISTLKTPLIKEKHNCKLIYCKFNQDELILISEKGELLRYKKENNIITNTLIFNTKINNSNSSAIENSFILLCKQRFIITVNHPDNSLRIFDCNKNIYLNRYILDEYVSSICKYSENEFLTGHKQGQLKHWKFKYLNSQVILNQKRFIYAHSLDIISIQLCNVFNVIITAGIDNYIYIRKAYDLELLTEIYINDSNLEIITFKCSNLNLIYVLCYDKQKQKNVIIGYTFSGIEFARSAESLYSNIETTKSGNLIVNDTEQNKINILKGGELTELGSFNIKSVKESQVNWISFNCDTKQKFIYVTTNDEENSLIGIPLEDLTEEYILFD